MIGESALSLVKEAARNQNNLNPFNEDVVRQSIEETRRLWDQNRLDKIFHYLKLIKFLFCELPSKQQGSNFNRNQFN